MKHSPEYNYSELPAIELFKKLGYQHLSGDLLNEREDITEVVLKERLSQAILRLNPWINDNNLYKATEAITQVQGASLMEINQQIWEEYLRGPIFRVKQNFEGKEEFRPVSFTGFEPHTQDKNEYLIVSQMAFHGRLGKSIPDLVVYLNGLPIAVLECKAPTADGAWDKAYRDLDHYQKYSEKLFYYNQICGGVWQVGGKYGAIGANPSFYSVFRTDDIQTLETLLGKPPTE